MKAKLVNSVLPALLRPLARFCVKHSISIRELLDAAKRTLLEAAQDELRKRGESVSYSRLALLTGLHRVEIPRLLAEREEVSLERPNLMSKIVNRWETQARYLTKNGSPRVLSVESEQSEFYRLSWSISQNLPPPAVLKELERLGIVKVTSRGVRLVKSGVVPTDDAARRYRLLADDILDLYLTVEEHMQAQGPPYDHHFRTTYDNIFGDALPEIKQWLLEEAKRFHARARKFLSSRDKDLNPSIDKEGGTRVTLTSFSHSAAAEAAENEESNQKAS